MNDLAALFRRLSVGVYVIGVADGERRGAFTAAWVTQVSFDPLLLVLSVNTQNASWSILRAGGVFTVNVLAHGQLELARRFGASSAREHDKLAGVPWHPAGNRAPVLDPCARGVMRAVLTHRPLAISSRNDALRA